MDLRHGWIVHKGVQKAGGADGCLAGVVVGVLAIGDEGA